MVTCPSVTVAIGLREDKIKKTGFRINQFLDELKELVETVKEE
ncbi:hypothetical protein AAIR98_000129, partial [Elusimicrobium simillimum]